MTPQDVILKFVCSIPAGPGRIVGICPYRDDVIVAMESGDIFSLQKDAFSETYKTSQIFPKEAP
jgi:hypothetical protein